MIYIKEKELQELVQIRKNEAVCTSLEVAEKFQKRHDNVLRDIDNLLKNEEIKERKMFCESSYQDEKGRTYRKYIMNRKGFSILAMGFTGDEAMHWKLMYSDAFDFMEDRLEDLQSPDHLEARSQGKITRKQETDVIQQFVEYAKAQGSTHAGYYYTNFSKMANAAVDVTDRNLASTQQLMELAVIESIIAKQMLAGMARENYYKDIYAECSMRAAQFKQIAYLG